MSCFPSDPMGESCSTQHPLQTLSLQRSTLELASSRERTLVTHRGVASTTLGFIGKTAEVAATRAEVLLSGTMAGELSEAGIFSRTITAQARLGLQTCVRSTSLTLSPKTTPH